MRPAPLPPPPRDQAPGAATDQAGRDTSSEPEEPGPRGPRGPGQGPPGGFDPSQMTPEGIEMMRSRMKERGMSDEQIDQAIERMKSGQFSPGQPPTRPQG